MAKKRKYYSVKPVKNKDILVIKPSLKYKEDNIHELNNNINRGTGYKKTKKNVIERKLKHKKNYKNMEGE